MPGFDSHSPAPQEARDPISERWNARLGLILFALYAVIYAAFVLANAFLPKRIGADFGPMNGALWGGFGLIFGAILLSILYAVLCWTPRSAGRR